MVKDFEIGETNGLTKTWIRFSFTCFADPAQTSKSSLGGFKMRSTHRYICSLFLGAVLLAPVAVMAIPAPQDAVQVRVYDRDHKDYHNWDGRENAAWGVYLTNNHRKSHEFSRASRKEQSQYWNWRHDHPDHD
jgi:hypothetical protein